MAFQCPQCQVSGSLEISQAIELNPDNRSDDITLQVVECRICGFEGLAVYEESRRGGWENESWDHTGYRVDKEKVEEVRQRIVLCPNPGDHHCTCANHEALSSQDQQGIWQRLDFLITERSFCMVLA